MEKHTFPLKDDPAVRYYKDPSLALAILLSVLSLLCLIGWAVTAGQERPNISPFGLLFIGAVLAFGAWTSWRGKAAATDTHIYVRPLFSAIRAIPVDTLRGYVLVNGRYGATVVLYRGGERWAALECTPELLNYLHDRGLRAQKNPDKIF